MNTHLACKALQAVSGALPSISSKRGDIASIYRNRTIDDLVISFMETFNIPGLSLAIVQAPYIPRVVSYGLASLETKRLASSNTMFNIGKLTNAYTAVAIMQLLEMNKLQLNDPISKYLDDLPSTWKDIQIYDLFTHSSGIFCFLHAPDFNYTQTYKPTDIINLVKKEPLVFETATNSHPSATDYYLLGMIIEKASGQSYEEFICVNQFERANLKNTCFISTQDKIKNEVNESQSAFKHSQFLHDIAFVNPTELAVGYTEIDDALNKMPLSTFGATFSDMGILSSAEDISIWDICLAGDIFIKEPKNRSFLYNPVQLRKGPVVPANAHWEFNGHPGYMQIRGNVPGYSSFLCRYTAPTELLCVTLLANKDDLENLDILARQIAGAYDGTLATPDTASANTTLQSPYSVSDTAKRVKHFIEKEGGSIFSHINHSEAASKANLKLKPTEVILFGNPSVGTALMQQQGAIAMELPLRAAIWEDEKNKVWISVTDVIALAEKYKLDAKLQALTKKMTMSLFKMLNQVIGQDVI